MTDNTELESRVETLEEELGIESDDGDEQLVNEVANVILSGNNVEDASEDGVVKTQYEGEADLTDSEVADLRSSEFEIKNITGNYVYIQESE